MNENERYTDSRMRINVDGQMVYATWCNRRRCMNKIIHQQETIEGEGTINEQRTWRYPHYAIVVSYDDGERKNVYCSFKCASIELAKKAKEK